MNTSRDKTGQRRYRCCNLTMAALKWASERQNASRKASCEQIRVLESSAQAKSLVFILPGSFLCQLADTSYSSHTLQGRCTRLRQDLYVCMCIPLPIHDNISGPACCSSKQWCVVLYPPDSQGKGMFLPCNPLPIVPAGMWAPVQATAIAMIAGVPPDQS